MKCGSATVRAAANAMLHGHGGTRLQPHLERGFRGIVRPLPVDLWTFGCTTCGYVEQYLLDPEALAFIQQNWMPIAPQGTPPDRPAGAGT